MSLDGVNKVSLINAGAEAGKEVAENGAFMVKTGAEAAQNIMKGGIFGAGANNILTGTLIDKSDLASIMFGVPKGGLKDLPSIADVVKGPLTTVEVKNPKVTNKGGIYFDKPSLIEQLKVMRDKIDKILEQVKTQEPKTTEKGQTIEEIYKNGKPGMILAHLPKDDGGIVDSTPHEIPPYSDGGIVGNPIDFPEEGPLGGRIIYDL